MLKKRILRAKLKKCIFTGINSILKGLGGCSRELNMETFSVTPIYATIAAAIWLILFFRVAALRSSLGQSVGDGGNPALLLRIRQHGNCADWCAFILILMILAEGMGAPDLYLHISGVLLIIGRLAHPFGLKVDNASHPLRYAGNLPNLAAAVNAMICLVVNLLGL
jgi:uncharacterized membrane protein YecN with MAPEG domain